MSTSRNEAYTCTKIRVVIGTDLFGLVNSEEERVILSPETVIELHTSDNKVIDSLHTSDFNHHKTSLFSQVDRNAAIEFYFAEDKITTAWPAHQTRNLMGFFKQFRPANKSKYCCTNFAYEIAYGRNYIEHDNSSAYFNEGSPDNFAEEKLAPGDVILLHNPSRSNFHYAISIGNQYYLSLFGTYGPLTATDLDVMKAMYGTDICRTVSKQPMPQLPLEKRRHSLFFSPSPIVSVQDDSKLDDAVESRLIAPARIKSE